MRVLDLFSGIGAFSLGLERAGMKTVAFCEIEPFLRRVLAKHWPGVPIYEDVRALTADGRIVKHRVRDGHLEIEFVYPDSLDMPRPEPGRWYPVPDDVILRGAAGAPIANPTGVDIAWWWNGHIFCYAQANEG